MTVRCTLDKLDPMLMDIKIGKREIVTQFTDSIEAIIKDCYKYSNEIRLCFKELLLDEVYMHYSMLYNDDLIGSNEKQVYAFNQYKKWVDKFNEIELLQELIILRNRIESEHYNKENKDESRKD